MRGIAVALCATAQESGSLVFDELPWASVALLTSVAPRIAAILLPPGRTVLSFHPVRPLQLRDLFSASCAADLFVFCQ